MPTGPNLQPDPMSLVITARPMADTTWEENNNRCTPSTGDQILGGYHQNRSYRRLLVMGACMDGVITWSVYGADTQVFAYGQVRKLPEMERG